MLINVHKDKIYYDYCKEDNILLPNLYLLYRRFGLNFMSHQDLCRITSYIIIPAATDTFKLLVFPTRGTFALESLFVIFEIAIPDSSLPNIIPKGIV